MKPQLPVKVFLLWAISFGLAMAQDPEAYEVGSFESEGSRLPYRILLPENFDSDQKYPLILVLHGSGERGDDNTSQLVHGSELFLKGSIRQGFPSIVVFPQCASGSSWARIDVRGEGNERELLFFENAPPTTDMVLLEGLIKALRKQYKIDRRRMYVGGLSMGGMGTFEIVRRNPKMFAAAFPICGGANPKIAKKLKRPAWWVFHGGADKVVDPGYSSRMVTALKGVGAAVKYSLYPDIGHNSWDNAFAEKDLLPWLFSQTK
ncbi:alpha/beta hydrolase-fold protein [Flagellimonas sp. DF-77]|uniref:carboxylesterase family protein n=1 Tax=Flagellimonas algarum TaxID=3230298 RepID=UPI003397BA55